MTEILKVIAVIRFSRAPVLILGESGVGKELIAQHVHRMSGVPGKLISQNCSGLNENLLESELFGHVRGSFTGAFKNKIGIFQSADFGTIFLDEVGDMPMTMQAKLLRVLQEKVVTPVGSVEGKKITVRILCATNKNISRMVELGTFREDLFYRLNVIPLEIPPLRERREDIPLLVKHFLPGRLIHDSTMRHLTSYHWPGNIRELKNETDRISAIFSAAKEVLPEHLSTQVKRVSRFSDKSGTLKIAMQELEKEYIMEAIKLNSGNLTKAAKVLGICRASVICKMQEMGLEEYRNDLRREKREMHDKI